MSAVEPGPRTKGGRTRSLIIDTALRLFKEHGFDQTTMRLIASEAGISVGNAYYYFPSKEHLIQGFYDRAGVEHRDLARTRLAGESGLARRLVVSTHAWIDAMEPYRSFAGAFFKYAAEPTSPLSPFSQESGPARVASIEFIGELIDASGMKIPKAVASELPELLWLYTMGVVLFWVHDASPHARGSRVLVERTAPLLERGVELSRLPVLRATIADLIALVNELKAL